MRPAASDLPTLPRAPPRQAERQASRRRLRRNAVPRAACAGHELHRDRRAERGDFRHDAASRHRRLRRTRHSLSRRGLRQHPLHRGARACRRPARPRRGDAQSSASPGGTLLATVPFAARVHHAPYDFHRFTRFRLAALFKDFRDVEVEERGDDLAVIANKLIAVAMRLARAAPAGRAAVAARHYCPACAGGAFRASRWRICRWCSAGVRGWTPWATASKRSKVEGWRGSALQRRARLQPDFRAGRLDPVSRAAAATAGSSPRRSGSARGAFSNSAAGQARLRRASRRATEAEVVAVDISEAFLERARAAPCIGRTCASRSSICWRRCRPARPFDLVFGNGILHHLVLAARRCLARASFARSPGRRPRLHRAELPQSLLRLYLRHRRRATFAKARARRDGVHAGRTSPRAAEGRLAGGGSGDARLPAARPADAARRVPSWRSSPRWRPPR